jgi:phosphopantetheinyl transferase (holo-ACP synthase)
LGAPQVVLYNRAARVAQGQVFVSISHDDERAVAFAVLG